MKRNGKWRLAASAGRNWLQAETYSSPDCTRALRTYARAHTRSAAARRAIQWCCISMKSSCCQQHPDLLSHCNQNELCAQRDGSDACKNADRCCVTDFFRPGPVAYCPSQQIQLCFPLSAPSCPLDVQKPVSASKSNLCRRPSVSNSRTAAQWRPLAAPIAVLRPHKNLSVHLYIYLYRYRTIICRSEPNGRQTKQRKRTATTKAL